MSQELRALDAAVAEKVMGYGVIQKAEDHRDGWGHTSEGGWFEFMPDLWVAGDPLHPVPHYSRDWSAMQRVVERMAELGWDVTMRNQRNPAANYAQFQNDDYRKHSESGTTLSLPEAVCRAALAAVGAG